MQINGLTLRKGVQQVLMHFSTRKMVQIKDPVDANCETLGNLAYPKLPKF